MSVLEGVRVRVDLEGKKSVEMCVAANRWSSGRHGDLGATMRRLRNGSAICHCMHVSGSAAALFR
jgi:hypothetical protein